MGGRMIRYPGGQKIPKNVVSAVKFLAKVGCFSTSQWHSYFGKGSLNGQQKQLKRLRERRIIKKHRGADGARFILDYHGEQIVRSLKLELVSPVAAQHFQHDELVANT